MKVIDFNDIKGFVFNSCLDEANQIISNYNSKINDIVTELNKQIAISEAKIYAYEKIIANSNFKAILKEKESKGK